MAEETKKFSFGNYAWKQFKKNKPACFSFYILVCLMGIGLLSPLLSNERPLFMRYKGETMFPACSFREQYTIKLSDGTVEMLQPDVTEWKKLAAENVVWPLIPYSPGKSDLINTNAAPSGEQQFENTDGQLVPMPSRFRHWLGTSARGEDVLAGLIHGTRISLTIGILSMGIASLLGLVLGAMAGYFGNEGLKTTRGRFWSTIAGFILAWFWAFMSRSYALSDALAVSGSVFLLQLLWSLVLFSGILYLASFAGKAAEKIPGLSVQVSIPVDSTISRLIEILHSLPILILILSIAAIARPSLTNLMIIIGLTSWTGIARLTRAEFLKIRNLEYIQAAKALGFSEPRIIFFHALKNGMAPSLVSIAFGIASAILIESSLSFLGVGVPPDVVTWGSLLSAGKANFSAWWLVVFPGLAIFITITVYNLIGEGLRDAFDPRLKK